MSTTDTPATPVPPPDAAAQAQADHISRLSDDQSEIWWSGVFGRRRSRFFLMTIQVFGTCAVSVVAVVISYLMLNHWPESMRPVRWTFLSLVPLVSRVPFAPEFRGYLPMLALAPLVNAVVFQWQGLYRSDYSNVVPFGASTRIVKGLILATLILAGLVVAYAYSQYGGSSPLSLMLMVYYVFLTLWGLVLFHSGVLTFVLMLQAFGLNRTRVALIQNFSAPPELIGALAAPSSQYQLVGMAALKSPPPPAASQPGVECLGSVDTLDEIINEHELDEIILAMDPATLSAEQRADIAQTCWRLGVDLKMVTPFYPFFHTSARPLYIGDVSVLQVEKIGLYARWPQVTKRCMDVAVSLIALSLAGPIILLAMLLIKLDSPGSVFFVQKRVGLNGRSFRMLKLRSMHTNADPKIHQQYLQQLIKLGTATEVGADGKPVYKLVNDPRVTRVGRFIRKTSIDELPQFINVLRGEMSMVGPRPPLKYEVDEYEDWHYKRLNIRPGITGLWQVSGRSRLTYEQMIQLDIAYIENWSLWADIKILLRTIPVVLKLGQSY
ncbi:MAG: sugar transferase [Candidatus Hydrogenedentes bacterium]|nr:sugar transferase [Candidatus Hydrogenedentota bacterium]